MYAFRHEIDAWLKSSERARAGGAHGDMPGPPEAGEHAGPSVNGHAAAQGVASAPALAERGVSRSIVGAFALLLLVVVGSLGWLARPGATVPDTVAAARRLQPASWKIQGHELSVFGEDGTRLWAYQLDRPVPDTWTPDTGGRWSSQVAIVDLDNDGSREVVFNVPVAGSREGYVLVCLDADGSTRWVRRPDDRQTFGDTVHGPVAGAPFHGHPQRRRHPHRVGRLHPQPALPERAGADRPRGAGEVALLEQRIHRFAGRGHVAGQAGAARRCVQQRAQGRVTGRAGLGRPVGHRPGRQPQVPVHDLPAGRTAGVPRLPAFARRSRAGRLYGSRRSLGQRRGGGDGLDARAPARRRRSGHDCSSPSTRNCGRAVSRCRSPTSSCTIGSSSRDASTGATRQPKSRRWCPSCAGTARGSSRSRLWAEASRRATVPAPLGGSGPNPGRIEGSRLRAPFDSRPLCGARSGQASLQPD